MANAWDQAQSETITDIAGTDVVGGGKTAPESVRMESSPEEIRRTIEAVDSGQLQLRNPAEVRGVELGRAALARYDELSPAVAPEVEEDSSPALAFEITGEAPKTGASRRADMVAVIQNGIEDIDALADARKSVIDNGKIQEALVNVSQYAATQREAEFNAATAQLIRNAQTPEEIEEALALGEMLRQNERARAAGLVEEAEFVEAVADFDNVNQDDMDASAVDLRILKDVEDLVDSIGLGQTLLDFGNILFVPGDIVEDTEDLVGVSNLFNGREELQKAVLGFNSIQDPAEKLFYWEQLKEMVSDKLNPTEAANILSIFATGDFAGAFEEYAAPSTVESITSLIPVLGTGAHAVRSLGTLSRVSYRLGNFRAAAKLAAKSLRSGTDAGAVDSGTASRADAADAASPIKIRGVSENDIAGLGPQVQRELQQFAASVDEEIGSIVEGSRVLTPRAALRGEREAAEMSLWNQGRNIVQNTKGDVVDLKIVRTGPEAMTLEISVVPKGAKLEDLTPSLVQELKRKPTRTTAQRNAVAQVEGEVKRIRSQNISKERKAEKIAALMNKKGLRDNVSTLLINAARASDDWATVVGALKEGQWGAAATRVLDAQRGNKYTGFDDSLLWNPALDNTLREQLKDMWEKSRAAVVEPKVIRHDIRARVSDFTGSLEQTELPTGSWFLSNRAVSRTPDTIENFETAAALDNISSKIFQVLTRRTEQVFDELKTEVGGVRVPLSGKQRKQKIDNALLAGDEFTDPATGDEVGKVWSPEELSAKFNLDEAEQAAYYKLRQLYDHMHVLKNEAARRELQALGFRDVKMRGKLNYKDKDGSEQSLQVHDIGRPYETHGVAWREAEGAGILEVFDFGTGLASPYSRQFVQGAYDRGQQLVRLRNPFKDPRTGKRHQFILASASQEIKDLPQEVLAYKPGYVPRVYDRGVWFVKAFPRQATIDGRNVSDRLPSKTDGMSDNRAAALRQAENLNMGGDGSVQYKVVAADQMDPIELMTAAPTGGGRLYVSGRGDRPVPFYTIRDNRLVEEKASRISALEALQGNISNIAYHYPRNEWRIAQALRLENTAKKLGVQYNGLHTLAGDAGGGPKAVDFINRQRSMLRDWLAAPDDAESWWSNTLQNLYEKSLNTKLLPSRGIWWLKSRNPLTAIRGATFHLMLGALNPVQLFVQAQGAAVAFSMHMRRDVSKMFGATEVARTWKMQNALSVLSDIDDEVLPAAAAELRRSRMISEVDADEMYALADAFKRSGLKEGVLTNADFSAMEQGWGQVMDAAAKLSDKALFFYRTGELFNRRFSFTTAFRELLDSNPAVRSRFDAARKDRQLYGGKKTTSPHFRLTDDELLEVTARANDMMLNLGRANRAAWQKGVLSVPTQFWQVQAKLIEELLLGGFKTDKPGAVFSRKERMKIMLGQIGLYGAAGMPVVGPAMSYYLDYNESGVAADPDSVANRTFDEGLYGLVFATLGADVEVAKRGAILSDLQDLAYDYILGDKTTAEAMTGAFNSIVGRTTDSWKRLYPLRLSMIDTDVPITQEDFLVAADAIGDLSTSWSNLTKAYIMATTGQSFSRGGNLLASENFSIPTIMFSAIGFAPRSDTKAYDLMTLDRMYTQTKADTKRSIRKMMLDYVVMAEATGGQVPEKAAKKLEKTAWVLMHYLRPDDRVQMLEDIRKEIVTGESQLAKATNRYVRINMEAYLDEAFSFYQKSVIGQVGMSEEDIK